MFDDRNLRHDLFALGLLAFTLFMALALGTYSVDDPLSEAVWPVSLIYQPDPLVYPPSAEIRNACGAAGATCADLQLKAFGLGSFAVIGCLGFVAIRMLMRRPIHGAGSRLTGGLIAFVAVLTAVQMFMPGAGPGPVIGPGGYIGAMGRSFLESHFATAGSLILLGSMVVGGMMLCTDYVLVHIGLLAGTACLSMVLHTVARIKANRQRRQRAQRPPRKVHDQAEPAAEPLTADLEDEYTTPGAKRNVVSDLANYPLDGEESAEEAATEASDLDEYDYEFEDQSQPAEDAADDEYAEDEEYETEGGEEAEDEADQPTVTVKTKSKADQQNEARSEVIAQLEEASREYDPQDYELPPIDLLVPGQALDVASLQDEVRRKASLLEKTFQDFKLDVKVVDIETGPVIAQYEIALKRGLSIKKIVGLADDLAIALRVPSVRIVAPIPGKNTVGIEVPNDKRQMVRLREVMEETNSRIKKMSIPIFLGKDVSGNPLAVDLAALPHLLIAGRTGTGKSVCLNAIISSMLMMKTPDDVRLLMVDPKMVELSGYARLPHLMHPVVTDMRKAEAILAWACEKMDERYRLLARAGVRHINSYNQLGEEELLERLQPESDDEAKSIPRHLPFIVIVADEMADLMMTAGKEVEAHIIRLASKSRAVGIHLILATQKPTVDVITGLIKSNLPARIAFQVASKTDSRVVLDENGADKLLGHGDLLFLWPGTSTLLRGQGTYLSDEEIDRIVDYCGSKGEQNFVRELVQLKVEDKDDGQGVEIKNRDELYEEAIEVVVREGRGSVSLLQRNLQIGYGRAARLIDFMAEDGIVGSYNGSQAREVLMSAADWKASKAGDGAALEPVDDASADAAEEAAPVRSTPPPRPNRRAPSLSPPTPPAPLRVVSSPAAWDADDEESDELDEADDDVSIVEADDTNTSDLSVLRAEDEAVEEEGPDDQPAQQADDVYDEDEVDDEDADEEEVDEHEEWDEVDEEEEEEEVAAEDAEDAEEDEEWQDIDEEEYEDEYEHEAVETAAELNTEEQDTEEQDAEEEETGDWDEPAAYDDELDYEDVDEEEEETVEAEAEEGDDDEAWDEQLEPAAEAEEEDDEPADDIDEVAAEGDVDEAEPAELNRPRRKPKSKRKPAGSSRRPAKRAREQHRQDSPAAPTRPHRGPKSPTGKPKSGKPKPGKAKSRPQAPSLVLHRSHIDE